MVSDVKSFILHYMLFNCNEISWRDCRSIIVILFYQESVLDAKLQELNSGGSPNTNGVHEHTINSVNAAHLNLREAIVKYENIVEELEGIWDSEVITFVFRRK